MSRYVYRRRGLSSAGAERKEIKKNSVGTPHQSTDRRVRRRCRRTLLEFLILLTIYNIYIYASSYDFI